MRNDLKSAYKGDLTITMFVLTVAAVGVVFFLRYAGDLPSSDTRVTEEASNLGCHEIIERTMSGPRQSCGSVLV
ncbi:MAG: hypothetical protein GC190_09975 [Alphaproteobacteria bacterium]|nr:hypothetical protein [Alphaproteobacteria bacterium]